MLSECQMGKSESDMEKSGQHSNDLETARANWAARFDGPKHWLLPEGENTTEAEELIYWDGCKSDKLKKCIGSFKCVGG